MYDNYRQDMMRYHYEKLMNDAKRMYDELSHLRYILSDKQTMLDNCDTDSFIEFFIKNPEEFNKIIVKMRKEKIKNIDKK